MSTRAALNEALDDLTAGRAPVYVHDAGNAEPVRRHRHATHNNSDALGEQAAPVRPNVCFQGWFGRTGDMAGESACSPGCVKTSTVL